MATFPPTTPSQSASAVGPCAVIAPTPVTTTLLDIQTPEHERHILSFKPAREREGRADLLLARLGHDIHADVRVLAADGGGDRPARQRQGGHRGVQGARRADEVSGRALDARD